MAYLKMYGGQLQPVQSYRTMTVILDLTNSDPTSWATYADDAVGMTAGSDAWDTFFGHYPCILENGVELGKLKRSNFAQYEDGTSAPITTLGKDVMICFPRKGIKIEYTDSSHLSVSMTDETDKAGYSYLAHSYKDNVCDKFYYGAYKGYVSSNKVYSSSGKIPSANITIGNFRNYAQARGSGYEQSAWFPLIFRQVMYLLKYKGRNAQTAVGMGFVNGSAVYGNTGYTNDKGMDWGENTGLYPMCLFGIEDFYGNIWEWVDGAIYTPQTNHGLNPIKMNDGNFNDTGDGYKYSYNAIGVSGSQTNLAVRFPLGTNISGFLPNHSESQSSDLMTYFCDSAHINDSVIGTPKFFAAFGAAWNGGDYAGVFRTALNSAYTAAFAAGGVSGRLMYMHVT